MKIEEDGYYILENNISGVGGAVTTVYISGDVGGGTVTFGYHDPSGNFIPFINGVVVVPSQTVINHGSDVVPYLYLTGSTDPLLHVLITGNG